MLPFIIGGVALAATGYGVAKILEDDCYCRDGYASSTIDESKSSSHEETEPKPFQEFMMLKSKLYKTAIKEAYEALSEIKNLSYQIEIANLEAITKEIVLDPTDENTNQIEEFSKVLEKSIIAQNQFLDRLDIVLVKSDNYEDFSDEDKNIVEDAIALYTMIIEACEVDISLDEISVGRTAKRCFGKLEQLSKEE